MGKKSKHGTIKLVERSGRLHLHFTAGGRRYRFALGLEDRPLHRKKAESIAYQIEIDILAGVFDSSLKRYIPGEALAAPCPIDLWDMWVKSLSLPYVTKERHYRTIRNWLQNTLKLQRFEDLPDLLDNSSLASTTFNQRLSYLKVWIEWLVDRGRLRSNPIRNYKSRRRKYLSRHRQSRFPLSNEEIHLILDAIKDDRFVPPKSAYKHSHYYPFVLFLAATGCRQGEAIALKRKHINYARQEVEICQSLSRHPNISGRQLKSTKTESIRILPLNSVLVDLLLPYKDLPPEEFIFKGPKGKPLDDHNLNRRLWKPVMKGLGIPYRTVYALRHSAGTRAIEQGIPVTQVSYMLGHSTVESTVRSYVHKQRPDKLPDL